MGNVFLPAVRRILILLVAVSLIETGCTGSGKENMHAKGQVPSGKEFAATWWDFYQRSLSFSEKGLYREAVQDLQQAIKGNDVDQWHVETPDGQIIDYFPHREMGIVYYRRQEYNKAVEQLEYSLANEASARACFFLDLARSAKIIRDGLDYAPPELDLETSTAREVTGSFVKHVKGVARDDTYVSSIQVGDRLISLQPAPKNHVFTTDIPLHEGENSIRVSATDLSGKMSEENLIVFGDRQGPLIEITGTALMQNNEYVVSGRVSDPGGLASLLINGRLWPITGTFEGYNFKFTLPAGTITITARDRADNVTQATLGDIDFTADAENDGTSTDSPGPSSVPVDSPENPEDSSASSSGQAEQVDNDPPSIRLEGMDTESTTFDDSVTIRVSVSDNEEIHSIFLNTLPVLTKNAGKAYFSYMKELQAGPNEFHFIAFDLQGNKTDKKIVVTRKISNIHQTASRMRIAVLPFAWSGNTGIQQQNIIEQLAGIIEKHGRFLAAAQQETLSFAGTPALSEKPHPGDQAAENNTAPPADAFLTGTINISSGYGEITGRLIDARTSGLMAFVDVFGEVAVPGDIDRLLDKLADALNCDFPLKQGQITDANEKGVTINLGAQDGIKPHSRFIIYRESPPIIHPVTRTVIQSEPDIIGILQVTEILEHSAGAEILSGNRPIWKFDKIIAK